MSEIPWNIDPAEREITIEENRVRLVIGEAIGARLTTLDQETGLWLFPQTLWIPGFPDFGIQSQTVDTLTFLARQGFTPTGTSVEIVLSLRILKEMTGRNMLFEPYTEQIIGDKIARWTLVGAVPHPEWNRSITRAYVVTRRGESSEFIDHSISGFPFTPALRSTAHNLR